MKIQSHFTLLGLIGGLVCFISSFVPWWTKNGISASGFTHGVAGVMTVILGLAAIVVSVGPFRKAHLFMRIIGFLTTFGALFHLWTGYKMHAIGWGLFLTLAAAGLMLAASMKRRNS